jgi:hypothetical protein
MANISLLVPTDCLETNVQEAMNCFEAEFKKFYRYRGRTNFYKLKLYYLLSQIGRIQKSDKYDAISDKINLEFNLLQPKQSMEDNVQDLILSKMRREYHDLAIPDSGGWSVLPEAKKFYKAKLRAVLKQLGAMQFAIKNHFNVK